MMYEEFDLGEGRVLRIARDLLAQHVADRAAFLKREMDYARAVSGVAK